MSIAPTPTDEKKHVRLEDQIINSVNNSDSSKRVSQNSRMVMAYAFSVITLLVAIVASHSILNRVIKTQRTLTHVNVIISDIKISLSDSMSVLSDYRQETRKTRPSLRMLQLISRSVIDTTNELDELQGNLTAMASDLEATPVWEETRWIVEDTQGSLQDKAGDYIQQLTLITTATANIDHAQIPVEAAGGRTGALFSGYQKASDLLEQKLQLNTEKIATVHTYLTALVIAVILLLSFLVVAPLWRRIIQEHQRLRKAHTKLFNIAYTDRDTGLPNLAGLESNLASVASYSDSSSSFYLLLVRIINLDELNNLIGSHKVDELLQSVSRRLQHWENTGLQWCRSGEAEFSTIVSESKFSAADEWVQALHFSLTSKLTIEGIVVRPEVSMATSRVEKSEASHANVLWEHQSNAKLASLNFQPPLCWLPEYHPGLKQKLSEQNNLINRISEGLAAGQFVPFYQIKVCAKTGNPCSIEVLARWITDDGSMIPPEEFIPAAESAGLTIKLTYTLFDQVLADIQRWCNSGIHLGRVAINVSGDVLHHSELLGRLHEMNKSLPSSCEGIEIEITENIALGDQIEQTGKILGQIRAMGIHVAIDDFGTGYASLQTLIDLPIDVLKIDRSFVLQMTKTGEGNEVVSAMISLSSMLNKRCVVEGVETEWQWTQLAELGADELQGFYFHKPANASATEDALLHSSELKLTGT